MNKKINVGAIVLASLVGVVAGGMFLRSKHKSNTDNMEEVDTLAAEIDIFDEES